jgi:hypothetical protein
MNKDNQKKEKINEKIKQFFNQHEEFQNERRKKDEDKKTGKNLKFSELDFGSPKGWEKELFFDGGRGWRRGER